MSAVTAAFAESGHDGPIPRDRDEHCPSKVRQVGPCSAGGRSACVLEHDPCRIAPSLSAHQQGRQSHGAGAQRACAAPASRSDSPYRSPAAFRPSRRGILAGMGTRPRSQAANDPRQHARQWRAVARCMLAVPPPGDPECGPLARSRPVREWSPASFKHSNRLVT